MNKTIEVVAAVIFDTQGRIFATQRGYGEWKDWWEFPGGKIEPGETPQQALRREIREELDAVIRLPYFPSHDALFQMPLGKRTFDFIGARSRQMAHPFRPPIRPMAPCRRRDNSGLE